MATSSRDMDYGAHLPLIALNGRPWSLRRLLEYAETAERLGFAALAANDHLLSPRPWLDGPTALATVLAATGRMDLMTTVALPVVRGPVPLAKSLTTLDILSGGRLIAGVGPGSSARDYERSGNRPVARPGNRSGSSWRSWRARRPVARRAHTDRLWSKTKTQGVSGAC